MAQKYENAQRWEKIIRAKLTPERFYHSCMVSQKAAELAGRWGADPCKAAEAGMVHDIMKDTPREGQLQTIGKYSIILDNVERTEPKLLHAICGAAVLRSEYGMTDEDMLAAVRYHTTARAGMSILEKVLYLADFISADRDYPGVPVLRVAVNRSLEDGMRTALDYSVRELLDKRAAIHPDTIAARNEMICGR